MVHIYKEQERHLQMGDFHCMRIKLNDIKSPSCVLIHWNNCQGYLEIITHENSDPFLKSPINRDSFINLNKFQNESERLIKNYFPHSSFRNSNDFRELAQRAMKLRYEIEAYNYIPNVTISDKEINRRVDNWLLNSCKHRHNGEWYNFGIDEYTRGKYKESKNFNLELNTFDRDKYERKSSDFRFFSFQYKYGNFFHTKDSVLPCNFYKDTTYTGIGAKNDMVWADYISHTPNTTSSTINNSINNNNMIWANYISHTPNTTSSTRGSNLVWADYISHTPNTTRSTR